MIKRMAVIACLIFTVVVASPSSVAFVGGVASASASVAQPAQATPDATIQGVGSPDVGGPRPRQAGDPGGPAQLTMLALLIAAVSFIMWKIIHGARGGQRS